MKSVIVNLGANPCRVTLPPPGQSASVQLGRWLGRMVAWLTAFRCRRSIAPNFGKSSGEKTNFRHTTAKRQTAKTDRTVDEFAKEMRKCRSILTTAQTVSNTSHSVQEIWTFLHNCWTIAQVCEIKMQNLG